MSLADFHRLDEESARAKLLECCHCEAWAEALAKERPYKNLAQLKKAGEQIFLSLGEHEWLEAFAGHPRIGDLASLRSKYSATQELAAGEQSGMGGAGEGVLRELQQLNLDYEKKFGFIFIVFASGKNAGEMLAILKSRINNDRQQELRNAAVEQNKITSLRMEKLL